MLFKTAGILLATCLIFIIFGMNAFALEPRKAFERDAENITGSCSLSVSEKAADLNRMLDSSLSTYWESSSDAFVEIQSSEKIGGIYIEWERTPGAWDLSIKSGMEYQNLLKGGESGFVNEFIRVTTPSRIVRLHWGKAGSPVSIARIRVYSPGEVPPDVQLWSPSCEKADILVIPTHADDEHLYFGGTLSTYAGDRLYKVQVVYLTCHEILRTREALAGLWVSGVRNYPVFSSFTDQYAATYEAAVKIYGLEKVQAYQVMLLRKFKPEVVVGHDLAGEYGHGMHIMNAKTLIQAVDMAEDPGKYPDTATQYGVWSVKKCYLHLYAENPIIMDWTLPLARFNGKSSWEIAKTGYLKHQSQQKFKFIVRIEGPNDCRKFGLYSTTVGPDIQKNDFMENIVTDTRSINSNNATTSTLTTTSASQVNEGRPASGTMTTSTLSSAKSDADTNTSSITITPRMQFMPLIVVIALVLLAFLLAIAFVWHNKTIKTLHSRNASNVKIRRIR